MDRVKRSVHGWLWVVLLAYCIVGIFYPRIGIAALICMLAPSVVAVFKGRMWCGYFCPRGSFNDVILSKFTLKKDPPKFLKTKSFRLLFLVLLMGAFALQIGLAWGSFEAVSLVFIRMIIITTALTIMLGILYSPRMWCRICPMGTMAGYVAKLQPMKGKFRHVTFDREKCIGCKICSKSCPVGIDVLSYKEIGTVTHGDCLKCRACVEKCPKKALKF